MSDIDIAWAAGLFEGEGCFTSVKITRQLKAGEKTYCYPQVSLSSTDKDVIEKFQRIIAMGNITQRDFEVERYKTLYIWTIYTRSDFDKFVDLVKPFLSLRRNEQLENIFKEITPRILQGDYRKPRKIMKNRKKHKVNLP